MDKQKVARELLTLAKTLTAGNKRVVVETDESDIKSIKQGERMKTKLENEGYTLVDERATPFRSWLTYELVTNDKARKAVDDARDMLGKVADAISDVVQESSDPRTKLLARKLGKSLNDADDTMRVISGIVGNSPVTR